MDALVNDARTHGRTDDAFDGLRSAYPVGLNEVLDSVDDDDDEGNGASGD